MKIKEFLMKNPKRSKENANLLIYMSALTGGAMIGMFSGPDTEDFDMSTRITMTIVGGVLAIGGYILGDSTIRYIDSEINERTMKNEADLVTFAFNSGKKEYDDTKNIILAMYGEEALDIINKVLKFENNGLQSKLDKCNDDKTMFYIPETDHYFYGCKDDIIDDIGNIKKPISSFIKSELDTLDGVEAVLMPKGYYIIA